MRRDFLFLLLMAVSLTGCIQREATPPQPSPQILRTATITPIPTQPPSSATATPDLPPPASTSLPETPTMALPPTEEGPTPQASPADLSDLALIEPGNAANLKPLAQLDGSLVFSPDSATFAVRKEAGLSLLDAQTLEEIAFLSCEQVYRCAFAYSPNGEMIAWVSQPGVISIWNLVTNEELSELSGFSEDCCIQITFSPDGELLAVMDGPTAILWDLANHRELFSLENVNEVHFSPDGKTLAFTSWEERILLTFWDITGNQPIRTLSGFETAAPVLSVHFSPDWKSVLWIARAHAQLMDGASGRLGPDLDLSAGVFSPDGRILAGTEQGWGDFPCTGRVCLFDVASGSLLSTLEHEGFVGEMDFSPDGRLLATVDPGGVKLWDLAGENEPVRLELGGMGTGVTFSPDGRMLATNMDGTVTQLWGIRP